MNRPQAFLEHIHAGHVLVADGATGTMLQSQGLKAGTVPEAWILEQPDQILALHRAYVEAGADIILTCSFGGNRHRLNSNGFGGRAVEVNRRAAQLAREAAGAGVFVAGDIGPTGELLAPLGKATPEELADDFAQQALALVEGGVDLMLVETMSDLGEARAAIEGIRRVSDLPIVCTFSFDLRGRTMMGVRPESAAEEIASLVDGVGANCGRDPSEFPGFVRAMRQAAPSTILWAKPNAGLPRIVDGHVTYDASPAFMGQIALDLREAGAQIIGGCCGTTPAHVAAMASALK